MRPLRIFLACQQDLGGQPHPVPAYRFWRDSFASALREAGHELLEADGCDWAAGLLPLDSGARTTWRDATWERALAWLRAEHARRPVDFFLGYLYPDQVHAGALAEIRRLGIPCVNFFCDNVREFRRIPSAFSPFDLHWVPEHKALPLYRRAGFPCLHAPMPCWVPPAQRTPVTQETLPVTFVGTRDAQRERLFADAIRLGLAVDLRGAGWSPSAGTPPRLPPRAKNPLRLVSRQVDFARQHGIGALLRRHAPVLRRGQAEMFDFTPWTRPSPAGEDYWLALRNCTVCLGVNRYPSPRFPFDNPDTYSRLRDIEAPMAGACYLTEWTEGLDELYAPGEEIETYRTATELVEKARGLSTDPTRRARLRAAGQRRALSEHTIARTLARIAGKLGIA